MTESAPAGISPPRRNLYRFVAVVLLLIPGVSSAGRAVGCSPCPGEWWRNPGDLWRPGGSSCLEEWVNVFN